MQCIKIEAKFRDRKAAQVWEITSVDESFKRLYDKLYIEYPNDTPVYRYEIISADAPHMLATKAHKVMSSLLGFSSVTRIEMTRMNLDV